MRQTLGDNSQGETFIDVLTSGPRSTSHLNRLKIRLIKVQIHSSNKVQIHYPLLFSFILELGGNDRCCTQEKSFLNLVNPNQIWIVITIFR